MRTVFPRRVRGLLFDLDGTLVDSGLDFDAMRREMLLPSHLSVLEALRQLTPRDADRCREILDRHEREGALRAVPLPGVSAFLRQIAPLGLRQGVVTRNSRKAARLALRRCDLNFRYVLTRDDGPVKPDPWAILRLCEEWDVRPSEVLVCGDFRFDIEAGIAAGAGTVLVCNGREPSSIAGYELADYCLPSFVESGGLLRLLRG